MCTLERVMHKVAIFDVLLSDAITLQCREQLRESCTRINMISLL